MFSANVVGTANAMSGGWGNLGGGFVQAFMPLVFLIVKACGATDDAAWRISLQVPGPFGAARPPSHAPPPASPPLPLHTHTHISGEGDPPAAQEPRDAADVLGRDTARAHCAAHATTRRGCVEEQSAGANTGRCRASARASRGARWSGTAAQERNAHDRLPHRAHTAAGGCPRGRGGGGDSAGPRVSLIPSAVLLPRACPCLFFARSTRDPTASRMALCRSRPCSSSSSGPRCSSSPTTAPRASGRTASRAPPRSA